jgi:hypothetical protein
LNAGFIDLGTLAALVFDCGQLAEALRFGDLKLEGYKTTVARFLYLLNRRGLTEPRG